MPHAASRIILATPRAVFRAFLDEEVVVKWRPPAGTTARMLAFDPRVGGGYLMELVSGALTATGPTSDRKADVVRARYVEILPERCIVEAMEFETDDPAFSGAMTLTAAFTPVTGGTKVALTAENAPTGIGEDEYRSDMEASLKRLANLLE